MKICEEIQRGETNLGRLWSKLDPEIRSAAASAFYGHDFGDGGLQQAAIDASLAAALNFRPTSFRSLPAERRSRSLAGSKRLPPEQVFSVLSAFHFEKRRALMVEFLDALGIKHDDGMIPPDHDEMEIDPGKLKEAVDGLFAHHPADEVELYLATLYLGDSEDWSAIGAAMKARSTS